jgi:hypothetical protein
MNTLYRQGDRRGSFTLQAHVDAGALARVFARTARHLTKPFGFCRLATHSVIIDLNVRRPFTYCFPELCSA